ncbi:GGDEF domain-containing protein [Sphingobium sp. CAP-1]|uniref:GGDEF domain-containing protein n=1 Tax=Sphingobium sp. CAP-1 TaxID=2676077 RepID=UPI0012BB46E7|nr:GGDEF domain-containing protein [Sphingobium sp. CAP-1]QGP80230.1 diguanylate cyclase [Sphingobium sp. CAP-1]
MQFYLATSFILPRSLRLRLFTLCLFATHAPLLIYLVWGLGTGRIALAECVLLVLATVIGAGVALRGISALLDPVHASAYAAMLPQGGDVIQAIHAGMPRAAGVTRAQIDDRHQSAREDPLTGIANRRGFLSELDALPAERRRGCVAIIDIDYFKRINDLKGHEEGDRVLAAFAARLTALVRRVDLVGRWGSEEFAIFFQDCIEDEASWSLARIAARMRSDPIGEIHDRPISFSAGICRWTGGELEAALRRADEALSDAKQAGRDRISRAAPVLQEA